MACADVETAKAKTTPINLTILSSYVNLQEAFLEARCSGEASRLWRKARVARRALQHSFYEPRPTKRKWVDVPTFSGANPVLVAEKRSVSSGDVARDLHPRRLRPVGVETARVRRAVRLQEAESRPKHGTGLATLRCRLPVASLAAAIWSVITGAVAYGQREGLRMASKPVVTDALRRQVREELPEVEQISDQALREKTVEAWAFALAHSTLQIDPRHPAGGQPRHQRGQARRPDRPPARRYAACDRHRQGDGCRLSRACHRYGCHRRRRPACTTSARPGNSTPPTASAGRRRRSRSGRPSIRHPAYGAHICLTVGLPEEVAHIAMAHSGEGELLVRSLECMIVHQADYTFWNTLLAGGQLKPETRAAR